MKFRAKKVNGKIDINWQRLELYVSKWKEGAVFTVEITRKQKRRRSDPMRKYYFAGVLPDIAEAAGYEKDEHLELHRFLKITYFNVSVDKKWGIHRDKDIPSVFSNDENRNPKFKPLTVKKKKKFVDWVIRKAAKAGIYISDPGE